MEAGDEPPLGTLVELWPVCQPYFDAWVQLEKSRLYAVGSTAVIPLGLQYSEVISYANVNGFSEPNELQFFVDMVYALDHTFLERAREKK